jgi:hypothetical protein
MDYPGWISTALKDTETVIRVAALIVGAAWAYMKFIKGRVFSSRLEADVSGDVFVKPDCAGGRSH